MNTVCYTRKLEYENLDDLEILLYITAALVYWASFQKENVMQSSSTTGIS